MVTDQGLHLFGNRFLFFKECIQKPLLGIHVSKEMEEFKHRKRVLNHLLCLEILDQPVAKHQVLLVLGGQVRLLDLDLRLGDNDVLDGGHC